MLTSATHGDPSCNIRTSNAIDGSSCNIRTSIAIDGPFRNISFSVTLDDPSCNILTSVTIDGPSCYILTCITKIDQTSVKLMSLLPPLNPTFYSKTAVFKGIHYFSYFCLKT